jgi:hypothetical protein
MLAQTPRETVNARMKAEPQVPQQEVLAGSVEGVTVHNEESGFCASVAGSADLDDNSVNQELSV